MAEDMAQENALDGPARFARAFQRRASGPGGLGRGILRVDQTCCVRIEAAGGALCRALPEHRLAGVRRDSDDPLTHKIEAAKEWSGTEMAGAAKVHEKLDERLAEFAELARKFVDTGLAVAVALPA